MMTYADNVHIRVQAVLGTQTSEVAMLRDFTDDVTDLTNGEVTFEILPASAVVGVRETLDAVDSGLIDGGFARHITGQASIRQRCYSAHPLRVPVWVSTTLRLTSWSTNAGKELYDQLWDEMGVNVKGFMLQPVGPEALGWFKEPINSMEDFRKYRFRTPPGLPGQTYKDSGVASVAIGGGDILPALEKGTIDAAEWCCPKPDSGLRLPESPEALLSAGPASGCCECGHVPEQGCL